MMESVTPEKMSFVKNFYRNYYKRAIFVPLSIVVIALVYLAVFYNAHGDIMEKDVSLKGGITATLYTDDESHTTTLEQELPKVLDEVRIRTLKEFGSTQQLGIIVETATLDEEEVTSAIQQATGLELNDDNYSIEIIGPSLGAAFYQQMIKAIFFAFIAMGIVVFLVFRVIVPSIAVISSAFFDITVTIAVVDMLGMHISIGGMAAFLLLVGYSVDTDVLLTNRTLKRQGAGVLDQVASSIKTGLTMTLTTAVTMIVALLLSTSFVLNEIFTIILIGLIVDIIVTYLFNAPILLMHINKKEGKIS